jgi:hypothetical protein
MFRFVGIVGPLCLPALAANVEPVATVEPVAGQVSFSRGHGFNEITGPTRANVGDQVMASIRGHAKIVYSEGCVVDVYPGAVVGVAGSCKVAAAKPMMAGLACDPSTDPKCLAPVPAAAAPLWPLLAGAALAVGAACVGFCASEEHHAHCITNC